MKKKLIAFLLALVLCAGVSACGAPTESDGEEPAEKTLEDKVNGILSGMSVEEKLTQMMIVALRSDSANSVAVTDLAAPYEDIISRYDFGGVILFGPNIVDTEQTVALIRSCQTAAAASAQKIPLFVCVDQEGGLVNRVSFGTVGPGNMALAAAGDTALTEECADIFGQELKALGFNTDFAPVSDVNNNPNNPIIGTRSFSDDPALAARHVTAFIKGLDKNNVSAALKHFPGHGNVGEDSHTHLPSSDLTVQQLKTCELIPFQAGIDAGADMIMTAHIQFPKIETGTYVSKQDGQTVCLPATLSRTVITELLRNEMGYDGVVVTDAMDMSAIAAHFDAIDAAALAINAGVDVLLCPVNLYQDEEINTLPDMDAYVRDLSARVTAGEIKEGELDDSVARILKLKIRKGILTDAPALSETEQLAAARATVGSAEHHAREWEMVRQGLTLLKNEGKTLPVDGNGNGNTLILVPNKYRMPAVEYALSRLEKEKRLTPSGVTVMTYGDLQSGDEALQKAVSEADRVLILSQSTAKNQLLCDVIEQTHRNNGKAALLSLNLPYDAACYPDADAVLCAYNPYGSAHDAEGNGPFNLNVAAALCAAFGQTVPSGTLPVNVPRLETAPDGSAVFSDQILFPRGSGLKNWG